jgi:hypothetical protein
MVGEYTGRDVFKEFTIFDIRVAIIFGRYTVKSVAVEIASYYRRV